MEFEVTLHRMDFYRYLSDRSFTEASRKALRLAGAAAVMGSLLLVYFKGVSQGAAMLVLACALLLWNPLVLFRRAGDLAGAAHSFNKLLYTLDAVGMTMKPAAGKPKRVVWKELLGYTDSKNQIIIYKDEGHVYILPKKQLPPEAEECIKSKLKPYSS